MRNEAGGILRLQGTKKIPSSSFGHLSKCRQTYSEQKEKKIQKMRAIVFRVIGCEQYKN
jgi:hypothetical protein